MQAYFVSDIHITSASDKNALALEAFLRQLIVDRRNPAIEHPTHVFLVGDIFDLWIGNHDFFKKQFAALVQVVRDCVLSGLHVHFFEGNHDLHLKEFWEDTIGVRVHSDAEYFKLASWTVRVEHGDMINPDDRGYLFLRRLLRHTWMRSLALNLPAWTVSAIGERASRASRRYTSSAKELSQERIRALIRSHAERAYLEKPFDFLITGHVHVRDDMVFLADHRSVRSINLGSWFDEQKVFRLSEKQADFVSIAAV